MKSTIRAGLLATCLGLVICAALALGGTLNVPQDVEIAVHWGLDGPDRFVRGSELGPYLWIFPGVIALIAVTLSLAPMFEPFRENLVRSRKAYLATWVALVVLFVLLQAGFVASAIGVIGERGDQTRWILAAVSAVLVLVGNYLPKTRQNFLMGIRTPWTLTSATAWEKTHKLGGPVFVLAGLVCFICAIVFGGRVAAFALALTLGPSTLGLIAYSWLVWRKSDDRMRPSDFVS